VSPSTFFRYFSTKEDLVVYSILDQVAIEEFKAQPVGLNPIQALRAAIGSAFDNFTNEELEELRERQALMRSIQELRARMLNELTQNLDVLAKLVSERIGRSGDDLVVRTFAGAVIGVIISVFFTDDENVKANLFKNIDVALDLLEAGLPL
jgi:AcrR family transcriptional regulator